MKQRKKRRNSREKEVLQLYKEGKTKRDISRIMDISIQAVYYHLKWGSEKN